MNEKTWVRNTTGLTAHAKIRMENENERI